MLCELVYQRLDGSDNGWSWVGSPLRPLRYLTLRHWRSWTALGALPAVSPPAPGHSSLSLQQLRVHPDLETFGVATVDTALGRLGHLTLVGPFLTPLEPLLLDSLDSPPEESPTGVTRPAWRGSRVRRLRSAELELTSEVKMVRGWSCAHFALSGKVELFRSWRTCLTHPSRRQRKLKIVRSS